MDFTLQKYRKLIIHLIRSGYTFYKFSDVYSRDKLNVPHVILRHDVDRLPFRAMKMAEVEAELAVVSTYFFRIKPVSFNKDVIKYILNRGHEIGYHYEELSDTKGNFELAWQMFQKNIKQFNQIVKIKTIAMHGRPFSRWDNRELWDKYDYKLLGVELEAYKDISWNRYLYFTDVGRSWNSKSNLRDKTCNNDLKNHTVSLIKTTDDLIKYINNKKNLNFVISTHPERWTDNKLGWIQVYLTDFIINITKRIIKLF